MRFFLVLCLSLATLLFPCFCRSSVTDAAATTTASTSTSTSAATSAAAALSTIPSLPQVTCDEAAATTPGLIWLSELVWYRFLVSIRRFVAMVTGRLPSLRPLLAFYLTARNGNLVYLTLVSSLSVLEMGDEDGRRKGRKKEGQSKYG